MKPTEWGAALRCALLCQITPEQFWRLSLNEWAALQRRDAGPSRQNLAELMQAWPDRKDKT